MKGDGKCKGTPFEDPEYDADFETRIESVFTEDGVELKLKRYVNEGAQPVLLVHGFLANGYCFDLPYKDHNMALYLAEHAYDVWIASFRGCGREPYRCETKNWNHSVDHLAALDAPAFVRGITRSTGKRPVWVGHSMGGMVLYMYLQGTRLEQSNRDFHVVSDPDLAAEHNRSILGGITIGSPPAFYSGGKEWPEVMLGMPFSKTLTGWMIQYLRWGNRFFPRLSLEGVPGVADSFPRVARILAAKGPFAASFYNIENVYPDVGYSLLKWTGDSVSTRMMAQILAMSRDCDLKDYYRRHNYTQKMGLITAPLFFISGSEDLAGPENIRIYGYEKVSSELKEFKLYPGYGHTDLVMGKRVAEEVFPDILSWIRNLPHLED